MFKIYKIFNKNQMLRLETEHYCIYKLNAKNCENKNLINFYCRLQ